MAEECARENADDSTPEASSDGELGQREAFAAPPPGARPQMASSVSEETVSFVDSDSDDAHLDDGACVRVRVRACDDVSVCLVYLSAHFLVSLSALYLFRTPFLAVSFPQSLILILRGIRIR